MTALNNPLFPPGDETEIPVRRGDTRDGEKYEISSEANLRVNIALATGRPLLVRGEPGTGKSSLAAYIARKLGWRYHEVVVTSRTEARDLMWRYDTLRRLNDAHAKKDRGAKAYVEPMALWWALDPTSAQSYGSKSRPNHASWELARDDVRDVVLIDEIDKADPEVPNDLLVAIGSLRFTVVETGDTIKGTIPPLLVFTTNRERDLPPAFLRRCITIKLETPSQAKLEEIGRRHYPQVLDEVRKAVVERLMDFRKKAVETGTRSPSIAEYLDTLAACHELGVTKGSPGWIAITQATLWKGSTPDGGSDD